MSRLTAMLLVVVLWAAIYLPGLGSTELRGEEGRRILPAVTMLETGNWLVPYVGGKPFLRKPPLMNWVIAASFQVTGLRNEWTARLPSALAVLALGLTIVVCSAASPSASASASSSSSLSRAERGTGGGGEADEEGDGEADEEGDGEADEDGDGEADEDGDGEADEDGDGEADEDGEGEADGGLWSPRTGLAAALMAMTTFGLLAKARFAGGEIEGVYAPLFGIALVTWLAAWKRGASPWGLWLVPAVFLGLAALAKGPLHVLFFYGIVLAVLWAEKRMRALLHPAHFLGVALMCGLFAAWAVPYFQTEAASKASKVWKDQMANRVTENKMDWKSYATNVPRGLGDLLPWVLFAPLLRRPRRASSPSASPSASASPVPRSAREGEEDAEAEAERPRWARPVLLASAAMWLALLLIPGLLPRYVLPLATPLALVFAVALAPTRFAGWPLRIGTALGVLSILYAIFAVPRINARDDLRPLAQVIDAAVPPGATLTLYDPGYQAWIFYLRSRYAYAPYLEDVPKPAPAVLARGKEGKKFAEKRPDLAVRHTFHDKNGAEFLLLTPR